MFTATKPAQISTLAFGDVFLSSNGYASGEDAPVDLAPGGQDANKYTETGSADGAQRWAWLPAPDDPNAPDGPKYAQLINLFTGRCLDTRGGEVVQHTCASASDTSSRTQMWTTKGLKQLPQTSGVEVTNPSSPGLALLSRAGNYLYASGPNSVSPDPHNATLWTVNSQ
ncbi:hypothetical protein ACFVXW_39560 [Streptomyces sp. NPDC058251]|uniref:hypothetical protein n=1 Tax=Streptomyces sp. NPDC058251 TaxID=3346404 RepID=UPI0036EA3019